ncbi:MAG: PspA/IM30 family protein [Polyangiaceae bacterium]|nr:PspA/IM30 family protein [Polyangiaceae bacterium]NUQ76328.1 PspA/IM30 family protein [Polyangiaceae bacterium]
MGIFARLATLIKSNLNDLISRSEDPEKMLNQVVIDMANQLIEAKKQVAVSIADEKRLAKQAEAEAANAAEWERRAMLAVRAGDDALATEALARKKEHDQLAAAYKDQWQKQKQAVDQLKTALRLLNNKIEEAKRKKNVLIARKKRAEAQKAIQETMGGLTNASAFETFDRMATKIDQIEAEAEAAGEIAEQYSGDVLAHKFGQLEATAGAAEDLMALKRKMGMAPPEPPKEVTTTPAPQMRVAQVPGGAAPVPQAEQDELAAALAELEAEEQREQARMKR